MARWSDGSSPSRPLTRIHSCARAGRDGSSVRLWSELARYRTSRAAHSRAKLADDWPRPLASSAKSMPACGTAGDLGHRVLVLEAVLGHLEVGGHEVDRVAVLARDDAPRRERPAVAQPLDVVDDRHRRVAGPQEVGVQRVDVAVLGDRPDAGDQGLRGHLSAEDPLAVGLGLAAPEQVDVERLDVEELDELVGGGGHAWSPFSCRSGCPAGRARRGTARTAGRSPRPSAAAGRRPAGCCRSPRRG